jgi:hypothetical protein
MALNTDRNLDPGRLITTSAHLAEWIDKAFAPSHLVQVARNISRLTQEAVVKAQKIREPIWPLRIGVWIAVLLFVIGAVYQVATHHIDEILKFLDDTKGAALYLAGFALAFFTIEVRLKRRRALEAISELRAVAHIVDMHQLAKDPAIEEFREGGRTEKMESYLHACTALLALLSKLGQMYVEHFPDTVATKAANDFEMISTGLSNKIWMKILSMKELAVAVPK